MLKQIQKKIKLRQYELSKHAVDQSIIRQITISELEEALITKAEVIEDYPEDKYGSSCLILGFTNILRPLHVLCSYPSRPLLKIITVYEPNPNMWINFKIRRK
ncbi:MAG: DUF4258 domain-containing protein [Kiritimatiellae bacterium]|nr:DUF4258 domain-containing protein [Kiritimatiellia bacterium]